MVWPWRRRARNEPVASDPVGEGTDTGERLAEEAEAFLGGRYRQYLLDRDRQVPGWAWLNTLAYGGIDDLVSDAGSEVADETPEAFVTQLTRQIVRLVDESGMELHDWQRRVLIPLEGRMRILFGAQVPRDRSQLACWLTRAAGEPVNPRSWLT